MTERLLIEERGSNDIAGDMSGLYEYDGEKNEITPEDSNILESDGCSISYTVIRLESGKPAIQVNEISIDENPDPHLYIDFGKESYNADELSADKLLELEGIVIQEEKEILAIRNCYIEGPYSRLSWEPALIK